MKQFGGLALIATLFAGSASADLVDLEFTPYGALINQHYDGSNFTSTVVASVDGAQQTQLSIPTGALTTQYLGSYHDDWNQATITDGYSSFESYALDPVAQPFIELLSGYLPASFNNPQGYSVLSAGNWFWDYDVEAELSGSVDYGSNYVAFQFQRFETIDSSTDELGTSTTSIYRQFNFMISLADLPTSGADVVSRSADDVRALFNGLNGESGYFYTSVGVQHDRCEQNSCWQSSFDSWQIAGRVSAHGERTIDVPVPATVLLLALGLPLLRRNRRG
ncbi:hypothetical protein HPT27_18880 [Permianibacter sp. IMCC34836]|uniref:hypothetical protein n=1 Tax=Permianibacter fluminis TaxID=2738515 RepID=UPI0015548807|nr:hypothetical protein [Permianibacter fluminis]NQD39087.1 hypothetical protein [Permianibacter fluminis]